MATTAADPDGGGPAMEQHAISTRLRDARRAAGLTQKEVAERIGVARRSVWEWENAVRLPTTALPALAEVYGVTAGFLLYGSNPVSVELREIQTAIIGELQALAREIKDVRRDVVDLAEATARALEAVRKLTDPAQGGPSLEPASDSPEQPGPSGNAP